MKKVGIFIAFLLLIGGAYVMYDYKTSTSVSRSSQSKKKTQEVSSILGRAPRTAASRQASWKTYTGTYLSFSYPPDVQVYDRKNANLEENENLLAFFRYDRSSPREKLVVQVVRTTVQGIDDFPAVISRRHQGGTYKETARTSGGVKWIVFTKEVSGIEETSFFFKDGKVYSLAISSPSSIEIFKTFDQVLETVRL